MIFQARSVYSHIVFQDKGFCTFSMCRTLLFYPYSGQNECLLSFKDYSASSAAASSVAASSVASSAVSSAAPESDLVLKYSCVLLFADLLRCLIKTEQLCHTVFMNFCYRCGQILVIPQLDRRCFLSCIKNFLYNRVFDVVSCIFYRNNLVVRVCNVCNFIR